MRKRRGKSPADFGFLAVGALTAGWFAWRASISPVAELGQADLLLTGGDLPLALLEDQALQWVTLALAIGEAARPGDGEEGRVMQGANASHAWVQVWCPGTPGVPADRVAVLREAFARAMNDPALLAEAEKVDLTKVIDRALSAPKK